MSDADRDSASFPTRLLRTVTPDIIRQRFALKFTLVLLLMGLSVGVVGATATDQIATQLEDNVENEYRNLAAQQAGLIETWHEQNQVLTEVTATSVEWSAYDRAAQEAKLNSLVDAREDFNAALLVNRSGTRATVMAGTDVSAGSAVNVSGRANVVRDTFTADGGEVFASEVYRESGTPVVAYGSYSGSGDAVLLVEVSVERIANQLRGEDRAEGGFSAVVTTQGSIYMSDQTDRILHQYAGSETAREPIEAADELRDSANPAGVSARMPANADVIDEEYAVGYAPIDGTDWLLLVHTPTSSVFGFVQTVQTGGYIATGVGVVLIALVGAAIGLSTSRSINRLRRRAEALEAGDLDVDIHSGRIDAIGKLYDSFASMRDALSQQINEAEQARKEAEVARAEAMEMNDHLQAKAEEYSEIMGLCVAGDLTQRMEPDDENEAMAQIATDFNEMIEELEKTTGQLKHFADEVEEAGEVVETSAESVRDASEQVAESIQHISDDAHEQQERLNRLATELDETIEQFERLASEADIDVSESVAQLRDVADSINDLADLTDDMMAESENVAGAAEEQAAELNAVSQQAQDLTRYARPLMDVLESFETEQEYEFYFPTGPGSPPTEQT